MQKESYLFFYLNELQPRQVSRWVWAGGCLGGLGGRLSRSGWARRMPRQSRH